MDLCSLQTFFAGFFLARFVKNLGLCVIAQEAKRKVARPMADLVTLTL